MRYIISAVFLTMFFAGCATWNGIKEDTSSAAKWTKEKVNDGAEYVKEKTD